MSGSDKLASLTCKYCDGGGDVCPTGQRCCTTCCDPTPTDKVGISIDYVCCETGPSSSKECVFKSETCKSSENKKCCEADEGWEPQCCNLGPFSPSECAYPSEVCKANKMCCGANSIITSVPSRDFQCTEGEICESMIALQCTPGGDCESMENPQCCDNSINTCTPTENVCGATSNTCCEGVTATCCTSSDTCCATSNSCVVPGNVCDATSNTCCEGGTATCCTSSDTCCAVSNSCVVPGYVCDVA